MMTTTTADLLERVRATGTELLPAGNKLRMRGPAPLPDDLRIELRCHKSEILRELGQDPVADFGRRISAASGWQELYDILSDADVSCVEGALTFDDIDTLCALARERSHRVPEDTV
jgi:hypothetical protein